MDVLDRDCQVHDGNVYAHFIGNAQDSRKINIDGER